MSYLMVEYLCGSCGLRSESLEDRGAVAQEIPCARCGSPAVRAVSAVMCKIPLATVTRGKNGPPPERALDTRELGDGMPLREWRKKVRAARKDARYREIKEAFRR